MKYLALIEKFRSSLECRGNADDSFFSYVGSDDLVSIDTPQLGVLAAAIVTIATSRGQANC
jgi:hypothetical protein